MAYLPQFGNPCYKRKNGTGYVMLQPNSIARGGQEFCRDRRKSVVIAEFFCVSSCWSPTQIAKECGVLRLPHPLW